MEEDNIQYTTFSTPQGKYEWMVMHFGLKNAPQIYRRKMNNIFIKFDEFSFINECRKEGIVLSKKKAVIEKQEIDFLGLLIAKRGIKLQTHISKKIEDFPNKIKSKEQIQKLLRCLNYVE